MSIDKYSIKATSYILNLLGDELIGSDSLAIFELVKNAYDADAELVKITFNDLETPNQSIVIEDDGNGMSLEILHKVWLTIGTDYKKKEAKISKKYKRVSLGNKGVGRLAVHRLADEILLETKVENEFFGSKLSINWKDLVKSSSYIQDLLVDIESDVESDFVKNRGTRITLTKLKTKKWNKTMLRELARKIENIKNPFEPIQNFNVEITCNDDKKDWLKDIKSGTEILDNSLFYFNFELSSNNETDFAEFIWNYKFRPKSFEKLEDKERTNKEDKQKQLLSISAKQYPIFEYKGKERYYLKNSDLELIGKIKGTFHVFNQKTPLLNTIHGAGRSGAIKSYIKENCGVKVYRDKMRVYNYGEPSDDWLGLEYAKVQRAGDHFSKKVTIGAVSLDLAESELGLLEKTNREGFSENEVFYRFKAIINEVFNFFERIASDDKGEIDARLDKITVNKRVGLSDTIDELEKKLEEKKLEKEFKPLVKKIEKDYNEMRDVMLNSGMVGLNLGLVFHEIEREMRFINSDLGLQNIDMQNIKERIKSLMLLLENFSPILKQQTKRKDIPLSKIVERVRQLNLNRFNYHNIIFSSPLLSEENEDFKITISGNLVISAISNIIDNAIYWVSAKKELEDDSFKPAIYIGTDLKSFDGPTLIIADNGNGFEIEPDVAVMPFKTRRPGGMGLGLYFVNLVLETVGGKLLFPDSKDLDIPEVYNGACLALVFKK